MASGITIKSKEDIEILREGGKRLSLILKRVAEAVRPGVTEFELNELAEKLIEEGGDSAPFKNYKPDMCRIAFPAAICISVNDEVVHGIPDKKVLKEGDIVGLDLGLEHKGMFTDMAITVAVGKISKEDEELMDITRKSLEAGIKAVRAGATTGDIGYAVESVIKPKKYGIVRELAGHGVGYSVHEPPYIPNYGRKGTGEKLSAGMVIAIEPMVNLGSDKIVEDKDKFTIRTKDGSKSAHFEKTVVVTEKGCEVLTPFL